MEQKGQFEHDVAQLVKRLPPMPSTIKKLLHAVGKPYEDDAVIELIKGDSSLCANLLHLANTFCGSENERIDTIDTAIKNVGVQPLVQLIGVWYANQAIPQEFSTLEYLDEYFKHAQDISLGCRILAQACGMGHEQRDTYTVAGLIHDIGRLVVILAISRTTTRLMGTPWSQMKSIVHDEMDLLGMDHCDVGMEICRNWEFSPFMQEAVLRHHSPIRDGDFCLSGTIIFIAHFISSSDFTGDILAEVLADGICDEMGLGADDLLAARDKYAQVKAGGG